MSCRDVVLGERDDGKNGSSVFLDLDFLLWVAVSQRMALKRSVRPAGHDCPALPMSILDVPSICLLHQV